MYSNVSKCLTQHGTIVHTRKVEWDFATPLGMFPATRYGDLPTAASGQPDVRLFAEGGAAAPTGASELAQASR